MGFAVPNRQNVLQSLVNTFGRDKAKELWQKACAETGVPSDCSDLEELESVAQTMANMNGALGVVGKSLSVRIITYKTLKGS